jgi:hypothetical protein
MFVIFSFSSLTSSLLNQLTECSEWLMRYVKYYKITEETK